MFPNVRKLDKQQKIARLLQTMKGRTTRYKGASDEPRLLKNDLDILREEMEELERVLAAPEDAVYYS